MHNQFTKYDNWGNPINNIPDPLTHSVFCPQCNMAHEHKVDPRDAMMQNMNNVVNHVYSAVETMNQHLTTLEKIFKDYTERQRTTLDVIARGITIMADPIEKMNELKK